MAALETSEDARALATGMIRTVLYSTLKEPNSIATLATIAKERFIKVHSGDLTFELTIDAAVEIMVVEALDRALAKGGAKRFAAVVLEPHTGNLLAIAERGEANLSEIRGLVSQVYEPAGSINYVTVAAGLNYGLVGAETMIDCGQGHYRESNLVQINDDDAFGILPVSQIVVKSSNIGTYLIAKRLGASRLYQSLREFGFGSRSGIDLPYESLGHIEPPDRWSAISLARVPLGYQISCTSIQVACAMAVIANGGDAIRPRLFRSVAMNDQIVPVEIQHAESPKKGVISKRTAAAVADMLKMAVTDGTGKRASIDGIEVAGKTGTARRYNPSTHIYEDGHYFVSFAGFASLNTSKVVCVVIADDPSGEDQDIRAGKVCAPVFGEIVEAILRGRVR